MKPLNPLLLSKYEKIARATAILVLIMSLVILVGWATNNSDLECLFPRFGIEGRSLPFMGRVPSAAAVDLLLYSAGLLLISIKSNNKFRLVGEGLTVIGIIGATIATVCMLTRQEVDGIRIFQFDESSMGITYPTPMAFEMGLDLMLLGAAILLLRVKRRTIATASEIAVLFAIPVPLLIALGAATQIKALCVLGGCFTMSTAFAILALLLCGAVFLSNPQVGLASSYSSTTTGGMVLRRATLFLFGIPVLLVVRAILIILPLQITPEVGWVIFDFLFILLAIAFIIPSVSAMDRTEVELISLLDVTKDELEKTRQSRSAMEAAGGGASGITMMKYKRVCMTCTSEFDDSYELCPNDQTTMTRIVDDSLIGMVFAEKYSITEMLGSGGMSSVYKARHLFLDKDVAVKVLRGSAAAAGDGLQRFKQEARATSKVSHVGIVGISDFGLAPDGRAFLVMDYLKGDSLSGLLDRLGPFGLPHVIALSSQICEALAAAHQAGIIHRDLKPSNIMLVNNPDGTAECKIVDFGLAKIIEEDSQQSLKLTKTGECFGSPLYMSPEQCMGKKLDHRTDIYALGAILYELLTGYPPIMGANVADTLRRQVMERPAPFPSDLKIPNDVKMIIYRCLQKDPKFRPQSALEVSNVFTKISIWSG